MSDYLVSLGLVQDFAARVKALEARVFKLEQLQGRYVEYWPSAYDEVSGVRLDRESDPDEEGHG